MPPMFLALLSRRLFDQSPAEALEWFAVSYARALYDAQRCSDPTAGADLVLPLMAIAGQPLVSYRLSHPDENAAAEQRALARKDLFADNVSPMWICVHGLAAMQQQLTGKPAPYPVKPADQWPPLQQRVRDTITADINRERAAHAARDALPKATVELRVSHKGTPFSLAWSPDGAQLAMSLNGDSHIVIWDARRATTVKELDRVTAITDDIAFTPDGGVIVTSSADKPGLDAEVSEIDLKSGAILHRFGHVNSNTAFALDRTRQIIAYLNRSPASLPQVGLSKLNNLGATMAPISIDKDVPSALAFDPRGLLAVGTLGGKIFFYDINNGNELVRTIDAFDHGWIKSLAFSPDGQRIVAGMDGGLGSYRGQDGQMHTVENPNSLKVFNSTTGALSFACVDHMNNFATQIRSVDWSPDGRLLAAISNNRVLLVDVDTPQHPHLLMQFGQNTAQFSNEAVAFSPDGTWLAMTGDNIALIVPIAGTYAAAAPSQTASCR